LASQHRTDFHPLNTCGLNGTGEVFRDLVVNVHDHIAVVVLDLLERHAAYNSVPQRLDNFASFNDSSDVNAIHRAAIVFADDYVLRNVNQTAGEITGIGRLERRIRQSLTRAVGRDEVLQHRQSLADVGGSWSIANLAR